MPEVICDTSPIQYLYQLELLDVLPALAKNVLAPPAVVKELEEGRVLGVPLPDIATLDWFTIRRPLSDLAAPTEPQITQITRIEDKENKSVQSAQSVVRKSVVPTSVRHHWNIRVVPSENHKTTDYTDGFPEKTQRRGDAKRKYSRFAEKTCLKPGFFALIFLRQDLFSVKPQMTQISWPSFCWPKTTRCTA